MRRLGWRLALVGVILLAFALRVWRLGEVPFGCHPDEAHNALDALRIAAGWRPAFLPGNNGREPLFMYLMAVLLGGLGPSIWAARLTAAVSGVLVVAAQAVFAGGVAASRDRRLAVLSAALVATSFWAVAQSRYALRAGLLPFWVALALWAWWHAIAALPMGSRARIEPDPHPARVHRSTARSRPRWWSLLTGVCLAGAVHTHMTGWLLPLALLASAAWVAGRTRRREALTALLVAFTVGAILVAPQVVYFARHPEMLGYRAGQVSVLNPVVNEGDLGGTLARNTWRLLASPVWEGDRSWYHNLPGRAVFDPLVGTFFLVGLFLTILDLFGRRAEAGRARAVLLLATLAVTAAPSWLSVGAPNYVRLTGTWPVIFLLPAEGLGAVVAWLRRRAGQRWAATVAVGVLATGSVVAATDYFGRYAPRREVAAAFHGPVVDRGRQVARLGRQGPTYVSPVLWGHSIIRFLNAAVPPGVFDATRGLVLPPAGEPRYVFDRSEAAAAASFADRWPAFRRVDAVDRWGGPSVTWFRTPPDWSPPVPAAPAVTFGGRMTLLGAAVEPATIEPGRTVTVTLLWRAESPTDLDRNLFVHAVTADERGAGQFDGPPLDGSYPTDRWQPGERILMTVPLVLDAAAAPGPVRLTIGWYDWRDGRRLDVPGDDDGAVEVATVALTAAEGR